MIGICGYCDEPIEETDEIELTEALVFGDDEKLHGAQLVRHRECEMRAVIGSVAHQTGKCSCFGGIEPEEKGTRREAAKAAVALFKERSRIR